MVRGDRRQINPHRRRPIREVLRVRADLRHQTEAAPVRAAQGAGDAANQQVTFLTDGGADVRELPLYLNPQAEHLIDWFHITMRLTVLGQMIKGLDPERSRRGDELERLKWFLWHGNAFRALQVIEDLKIDLDVEDPTERQRKLYKALAEFEHYIDANAAWIPNYGERYRRGEAISNAFVESAVNQVVSKRMVKKQQMRWTPRGAHLLLQIRTQVLNEDLAGTFQRWYPGLILALMGCGARRTLCRGDVTGT